MIDNRLLPPPPFTNLFMSSLTPYYSFSMIMASSWWRGCGDNIVGYVVSASSPCKKWWLGTPSWQSDNFVPSMPQWRWLPPYEELNDLKRIFLGTSALSGGFLPSQFSLQGIILRMKKYPTPFTQSSTYPSARKFLPTLLRSLPLQKLFPSILWYSDPTLISD